MASNRQPGVLSRRTALRVGAVAGVVGVAGCLGSETSVDQERARSRPTLGDPDAAVTIEVFKHFACPHYQRFNQNVAVKFEADYVESGDVEYQHYSLPLPVDEDVSWRAPSAARSVLGQTDHETFFEYVSLLSENQSRLGPDVYVELATEVGADDDTARTAAKESRYREPVQADREEARARNVSGTPAVFIEGENAAEQGGIRLHTLRGQIEALL